MQGNTLADVERGKEEIKKRGVQIEKIASSKKTLYEQFNKFSSSRPEDEDHEDACLVCHL